ncbi:MAG: MFS transporter [Anaerolineae bacterium]|nr:MFS transporter [Anaerolineae bacterium]
MTAKAYESGLSFLQKVQFYIGSGGRSIIGGLVNSAFIKYYTDFIGLDPKWMGYVYILFTVWAAINDPIFGQWLDKRPYRQGIGKYRPAFVRSIPFLVVITLAFPWASPSWSQLGISIYLFFALTLWETAGTIFGITYGAIATNLFLTTKERAQVEVIDNYVGALTIFGSTIPIMILSMEVTNQTMLLFFGIVTVASGLIMAISIPVVREREEFYSHEKVETFSINEFFAEMVNLLKERAFLYYFLTFLLFQRVASDYLVGLSYLYDNLILSKGVWTGLPDILIGIMGLILFPFIAKWIRKFGTKTVLTRMIIVSMVGYVLLTFVPATQGGSLNMVKVFGIEIPGEKSYWIATLMYFVVYVGLSAVYTANGPIGKRLIDYLEIKTGQRRPGTIKGVLGVLMTPGKAIFIFFYTQIISAFGYDGASKVQDVTSQWGIRLATGMLPAVMILVGLFFWSKYPLDKKTEDQVEAETLAKHRPE